VAEDNKKIIAACIAYEFPKVLDGNHRLLIEEMVVDPAYQGKGIGSQLINHLEQYAVSQRIKYIKVTTGTKLKANHFYQKHGYIHFENAYRKKMF
jgi:aminoglycoside 6'-N-acetyltransferase I